MLLDALRSESGMQKIRDLLDPNIVSIKEILDSKLAIIIQEI